MAELTERAATELHHIVAQYGAGEAEVARAYFSQPHTDADHIDVLLRQAGREIQTADRLHQAVQMLGQLDTSVDRHVFADLLEKIAQETMHFVVLADLAEWVAGRKLEAEELHHYEVHAVWDPDGVQGKDHHARLPEANRMIEVSRELTSALGYERGRKVIQLSEGGGGGTFIECARMGGDPFKDRLAEAMGRILKDELTHGPEHVDEFARTWVRSESDLGDATRWLRTYMFQHLRMRNEIWDYPLSEERLAAIDRGEIALLDVPA